LFRNLSSLLPCIGCRERRPSTPARCRCTPQPEPRSLSYCRGGSCKIHALLVPAAHLPYLRRCRPPSRASVRRTMLKVSDMCLQLYCTSVCCLNLSFVPDGCPLLSAKLLL